MPTKEQIEAGKSPKGGFTRKQLAEWGVPWPPPRGWRKKMIEESRQKRKDPTFEDRIVALTRIENAAERGETWAINRLALLDRYLTDFAPLNQTPLPNPDQKMADE